MSDRGNGGGSSSMNFIELPTANSQLHFLSEIIFKKYDILFSSASGRL